MDTYSQKLVIRTRAIIIHDGKILAVRHSNDHDFYALPGGHLEPPEDIKDSMKREIFEEMGVIPTLGRLLYINNFIEMEIGKQSVEFFFEVTNSQDFLDIDKLKGTHSHELVDIAWLDKDTDKKILPEQIKIDLKNNAILSDIVRFI